MSVKTFKAILKDNPPHLTLKYGVKLECLYRQHRARVVRDYLVLSYKWWIFDLYNNS